MTSCVSRMVSFVTSCVSGVVPLGRHVSSLNREVDPLKF